jgi:hypothetical protein
VENDELFDKALGIFKEREREAREGITGALEGSANGGLARLLGPTRFSTPATTIRPRGRRRVHDQRYSDEMIAAKLVTEESKQRVLAKEERKLELEIEMLEKQKERQRDPDDRESLNPTDTQ